MLRHIAEADNAYKANEKLQVLRGIRNDRRVPLPLGYGEREVCRLTQWGTPNDGAEGGRRDHVERAFACTILLIAASVEDEERRPGHYLMGDFEGENDTVACLLESGHVLGATTMTAIGQLLSWRVQRVGDLPARMFFALGMLFVAVLAEDATRFPKRDVVELGEWLL